MLIRQAQRDPLRKNAVVANDLVPIGKFHARLSLVERSHSLVAPAHGCARKVVQSTNLDHRAIETPSARDASGP